MKLFKFLRIKKNSFESQLDQFVTGKELLDDACIEIEKRMKDQALAAVDFIESIKSFESRMSTLEKEVESSKKAYEKAAAEKKEESFIKNLIQIHLMKKEHLVAMQEQMKVLNERRVKLENNIRDMNMKKMKIEAKAELLRSDIAFMEANKTTSFNYKSLNIDDIFKEAEDIINKKKFRFEAEEEVKQMQVEQTTETVNYDSEVDEIYNSLN